MYGYRYKPTGMVFELPGRGLDSAITDVISRRQQQARNNNPVTVELVERDGDDWRPVPLSDENGGVQ
jgi:hypothetical protein